MISFIILTNIEDIEVGDCSFAKGSGTAVHVRLLKKVEIYILIRLKD